MKKKEGNNLKSLGSGRTEYVYDNPSIKILETFKNKHQDQIFLVPFVQDRDEFSSLCVGGDTKIDIATNETEHPRGISIRELVGTEGVVFGFDPETKSPVVRRYHSVRKTQEQIRTIKITLEHISNDGSGGVTRFLKQIVTTSDHLVLISTGWHKFAWIKAIELKPGIRLIADQRANDTIRGKSRHRLISEYLCGRELTHFDHVHHIDENHFNNNPDNLEVKSNSRHLSDHKIKKYGYTDSLPDLSILVALFNSGEENFTSLAKKYNCDQSTIFSRIGHLVNKRSQGESLVCKANSRLKEIPKECRKYYKQGYTIYELSQFYDVHTTTISSWIARAGGRLRTSLQTKDLRKTISLSSLNHRFVSIEEAGKQDVYNMEVEEIENFFGDGVVLHNCPVTKQPDFARMEIIYVPNDKMVESKSLKLYFFSFRNSGEFHEDVCNRIVKDLWMKLEPKYLRVFGDFAPRGGIAIKPLIERWQKDLKNVIVKDIISIVNSWDRKNQML